MSNCEVHFLNILISVFDEANCRSRFVAEVEIGPNTFDIPIWNGFVYVRILAFVVHGDESVSILSEPDCQNSISKLDVAVWVISGQSRDKVPWLILSVLEDRWVSCQEPEPVTVAILINFL